MRRALSRIMRPFARLPFRYVVTRALLAVPTMFAIITLAFFLMRAAPGNPYSTDRLLPPEVEQNIRASLGLDKPVIIQYLSYLGNVVRGDLGPSMRNKDKSVSDLIAEGLPVSLTIGVLAMTFALIIGTGLGLVGAVRKNSALDYSVMATSMIGISIPSFVTGPILSLIFAVWLGWFSAGGLDLGRMTFNNLFLPIFTLALPQIAIIARLTRASMIEVLGANFIRTARAKGVDGKWIILRHAVPAAALPIVSYLGPACAGLLTGSVVIERVFGLPGVGQLFVDGAINRDYPLVMGVVILYAGLIVAFNLITDLAYGLLDPRIKHA